MRNSKFLAIRHLARRTLTTIGAKLHPELDRALVRIEAEGRMATAFARAAATAATRQIDPTNPLSWEFTGFSQHGEDGILDYLCSRLPTRNRHFLEIGAADGIENCSAWLAFGRGYGGVMVEGDPALSERCRSVLQGRLWSVQAIQMMVDRDNVVGLLKACPMLDPDVFSIDIDGIDYHVLAAALDTGFRPRIVVAEYNSAYGPDRAVTVPYRPMFDRWAVHPTGLHYGVSIAALRTLMTRHGYQFISVESCGVNAFFADPRQFDGGFLEGLRGLGFANNVGDLNGTTRPFRDDCGNLVTPPRDWRTQMELLKDAEFFEV